MRIGILGGTFNPIHYGHLRAAQEVQEIFVFNELLFIPSGRPPFRKPWLIDARHRYEMTKIAIKDNPSFEISDIEIKTKGTSYSIETVSRLKDRYKNAEFYFIIGIDAFLDLPKWKQPVKFTELTNLIIISRPGFSFNEISSSPYFPNLHKKTMKEFDDGKRKRFSFGLKSGKKAFLCRVTELDISASCIRGLIKTGKNIKYLLPESVESYIITNKLYLGK
jgi:nicotinate-nucleotide adenylyltransferase